MSKLEVFVGELGSAADQLPPGGLGRNLLGFVLRATWRQQALLLLTTLASLPFYYLSLEIAKTLVNRVFLAHARDEIVVLQMFGIDVYTAPARAVLIELSLAFLGSVLFYELLKMFVNIYKGLLTERVLARMRRTLLAMAGDPSRQKRSPLHGRLTPMVVMEPEPIGGFCGDVVALPAVQGGLLVTALIFIFAQDAVLGLAALTLFPLQAWIFPKLVARRTALELERVAMVGHDIGLMVAYAYAAQFPQSTERVALMDAFLPGIGDWTHVWLLRDLWHFHFYGERPLALVKGRERIYLEHFWNDFAADRKRSVPEADRRLYAKAYAQPGAMRAGFEYFRNFERDAADFAMLGQAKLTMPILVLSGEKAGGTFLIDQARMVASDVRGQVITGSGHWLMEEAPTTVIPALLDFLH